MSVYELQNNTWVWTEQHLYGADRIGVEKIIVDGITTVEVPVYVDCPGPPGTISMPCLAGDMLVTTVHYSYHGVKHYELTNHLGNVMVVVTDQSYAEGLVVLPTVVSATDYFPFGMEMVGRSFSSETYGFGFNGKEKEKEIGSSIYAFEARLYNSALGRFFTPDPREAEYSWQTTYAYFSNCPASVIDYLGMGSEVEPPIGNDPPITPGSLEGELTSTRFLPNSAHAYEYRTQDWIWHQGGVNGSEAEWMLPEDYYEAVQKPMTREYDSWVANNYSGMSGSLNNYWNNLNSSGTSAAHLLSASSDYLKANPSYDSWDSWVPIWGSANQASLDFEAGNYGRGTLQSVLAVGDCFVIGTLGKLPLKAAAKTLLSKTIPLYNPSYGRFGLNAGNGLFGRNGYKIGTLKIDALYANPSAGISITGRTAGTYLSLRSTNTGGFLYRWDYGMIHGSSVMATHATIRFTVRGVQYGSTAQRLPYPSSLSAPFFKPYPLLTN
jgi:RHS repeat-associated protein